MIFIAQRPTTTHANRHLLLIFTSWNLALVHTEVNHNYIRNIPYCTHLYVHMHLVTSAQLMSLALGEKHVLHMNSEWLCLPYTKACMSACTVTALGVLFCFALLFVWLCLLLSSFLLSLKNVYRCLYSHACKCTCIGSRPSPFHVRGGRPGTEAINVAGRK